MAFHKKILHSAGLAPCRPLRSRPADMDLLRHLAFVLAADGQRDAALAHAERACELAPHDARAWSDRGCIHGLLGEWREAVAQFSAALDVERDFAVGWHNFGVGLARLGEMRAAWRALRNAFLLAGRAETCLALGHVLAETGRVEAAIDNFTRAETLGCALITPSRRPR
jgi:Flp pilus assembly protein TadD